MTFVACLVFVSCAASDEGDTNDTDAPEDTDPGLVHTEIVEFDSQGVACLSGPTTPEFGANETIGITVDFGCVDGCNLLSTETRCSASLLGDTLSLQSHGHAVYEVQEPDPSATQTTPCTASCVPLAASCEFTDGLAEGNWIFSYSAVVVPFTVPNAVAICAADTDDT